MDREVELAVRYLNNPLPLAPDPEKRSFISNASMLGGPPAPAILAKLGTSDGLSDVGASCAQLTSSNEIGSKLSDRMCVVFMVNLPSESRIEPVTTRHRQRRLRAAADHPSF